MKNSTIFLVAFLILAAIASFGIILPFMISAADTTLVLGGCGLIFVIVAGAAMALNSLIKRRRKR